MPVTSLTTVHSQEGGQKWMSTASLVSLMPLCLDTKREKNQGLLPSQLNYARFYYCNMHTSFTDLCVYHTHTHSLPNSFSVFILSLFIDWFVHMCDVCMYVCAHAHRHMCDTVHLWRSEDNLSIHPHLPLYYTGFFFVACGCAQQAHWPLSSGDSPISASHLTIVLGLQMCNTAPRFTWF